MPTCVAQLAEPQWPALPVGELLLLVQWPPQQLLHKQAQPLLCRAPTTTITSTSHLHAPAPPLKPTPAHLDLGVSRHRESRVQRSLGEGEIQVYRLANSSMTYMTIIEVYL